MEPLLSIAGELSIADLISLVSTNLRSQSEDVWNEKLVASGYPRVAICAQSLWYLTESGLPPAAQFIVAGNAGIVCHMKAIISRAQVSALTYPIYLEAYCTYAKDEYPCRDYLVEWFRSTYKNVPLDVVIGSVSWNNVAKANRVKCLRFIFACYQPTEYSLAEIMGQYREDTDVILEALLMEVIDVSYLPEYAKILGMVMVTWPLLFQPIREEHYTLAQASVSRMWNRLSYELGENKHKSEYARAFACACRILHKERVWNRTVRRHPELANLS